MTARFWIGIAGGFSQLCYGKARPLKRMTVGDWLIYYSPKWRAVAVLVTAGLGTHQPNQRLPLAQQTKIGAGGLQAVAAASTGLAYDF